MRLDDIERLCLGIVPGSGEVAVQPLGAGLISETYKVERDGIAYALKIAAGCPVDLGLDVAWESRVLERAAAAKLAPTLVYSDPERALILSKWAPGRTWQPGTVKRPDSMRKITGILRRVHALPVPDAPRVMSPLSWIELYSRTLANDRCAADAGLREEADARLKELSKLPAAAAVVCHSDLHRMNLLQDGDALILLDWEYVHVSERFWDLAGWAANNDFEPQDTDELLKHYLGADPAASDRLRSRLMAWLYDYVCLLWSKLYLNARAGAPDVVSREIARRATFLDARLRLPAHYTT
jgi:thiamine kinase-like enzyme